MKYIAILDDTMLSNFDLENENGLILVVNDKNGVRRGVKLKPVVTNTLTTEEGESFYLTQGHIDAMKHYEEIITIKEAVDRMGESLSATRI